MCNPAISLQRNREKKNHGIKSLSRSQVQFLTGVNQSLSLFVLVLDIGFTHWTMMNVIKMMQNVKVGLPKILRNLEFHGFFRLASPSLGTTELMSLFNLCFTFCTTLGV